MTRPVSDIAALSASLAGLASTAATAAPAKDKASIYLSVGALRDGVQIDSPTFDASKDLVTLPQMIGLDNMNPDTRRAGTVEFANQQAERNDFLTDLVEQSMATLTPGETRILPFYVTIYRKKDEVVADTAVVAARPKVSFFG